MRKLALFILSSLLSLSVYAQRQQTPADSVDNDFVIASLVVADPGNVLYSTVGHVALRMQCPSAGLDYVFTYESEPVPRKVPTFLAGQLKMGMFAVPFQDYLSIYKEEHRGVKEYTLNLPLDVKRNLWRVCDDHVAEGPNLPYDYLERGCAHSALTIIEEGLDTIPINFGKWPEHLTTLNRRQIVHSHLDNHLWTRAFLYLICNGEVTDELPEHDKVIIPSDLVEVLKTATLAGTPLITKAPTVILPSEHHPEAHWFSPLLLSFVILALTILCILLRRRVMDYVLLALQFLLGAFTLYLVLASTLVCTQSSPLLVPFCPLALVLWRWRRYWCLPYAVVIGIWIVCALCWPYALTDPAYIVLSAALMASYINMYLQSKKGNKI